MKVYGSKHSVPYGTKLILHLKVINIASMMKVYGSKHSVPYGTKLILHLKVINIASLILLDINLCTVYLIIRCIQ